MSWRTFRDSEGMLVVEVSLCSVATGKRSGISFDFDEAQAVAEFVRLLREVAQRVEDRGTLRPGFRLVDRDGVVVGKFAAHMAGPDVLM